MFNEKPYKYDFTPLNIPVFLDIHNLYSQFGNESSNSPMMENSLYYPFSKLEGSMSHDLTVFQEPEFHQDLNFADDKEDRLRSSEVFNFYKPSSKGTKRKTSGMVKEDKNKRQR